MDIDSFKKYANSGVEIFKGNQKEIEKISKDKKALGYAVLFQAIWGIALGIGGLNLVLAFTYAIYMPVSMFIGIGILHILAKLFGGKGEFQKFYQTIGLSFVPLWISVIPILGTIIALFLSLWILYVEILCVKIVHKLSTGKAIVVVLIPLIIAIILTVSLALIFMAIIYANTSGQPSITGFVPFF